jgi:hypothetical protein
MMINPPPERQMSERPVPDTPSEIPFLQRLYDRPFVLLAIGFLVMLVLFTGWGLWEVYSLPVSTLP